MSKSALQNKETHYDEFNRILNLIWSDIEAHHLHKTQYILKFDSASLRRWANLQLFPDGNLSDSFRIELIEKITHTYPGCSITYSETIGQKGKIVEQMFVINWS